MYRQRGTTTCGQFLRCNYSRDLYECSRLSLCEFCLMRNREISEMDKRRLERTIDCILQKVDGATFSDKPFVHLTFGDIFPSDLYQEMLGSMPGANDYRALPGTKWPQPESRRHRDARKGGSYSHSSANFPKKSRKCGSSSGKRCARTKSDKPSCASLRRVSSSGLEIDLEEVKMYPIPVLLATCRATSLNRIPTRIGKGLLSDLSAQGQCTHEHRHHPAWARRERKVHARPSNEFFA